MIEAPTIPVTETMRRQVEELGLLRKLAHEQIDLMDRRQLKKFLGYRHIVIPKTKAEFQR
jgi:hypothetical protein